MISEARYRFFDRKPAPPDLRAELLEGLRGLPKRLSPKFFYDENGSRLFERITELPEYYLTRTEVALIEEYREEIARLVGNVGSLIEYGSGGTLKIRLLLETIRPTCYVPVDISDGHLETTARQLHDDYPWLHVYPTSADFSGPFELPPDIGPEQRLAFFPGSSIGNFDPADAERFLHGVNETVGAGGRLLIGVDRKKDSALLDRAYNDAAGVTREFNLNALHNANVTLDTDFNAERFSHLAYYNEELGAIQMFLESEIDQTVRVDGAAIEFAAGERLHTENSYKYDPEEFTRMAERAGFRREAWWTDDNEWFTLFLLAA